MLATLPDFGNLFADAWFDIVGMCEVSVEKQLDGVENAYADSYADVDTRHGQPDLGVMVGGRDPTATETHRNITDEQHSQYENRGPGGTFLRGEGFLRTTIEIPTLPGNPELDILVTHLQGVKSDQGRKDKKQSVKIQQMRHFADAVGNHVENREHRPTIVMGDFNIHSQGHAYGDSDDDYGNTVDDGQYFSNLMQQMRARGLQDVWLSYGGPGKASTDCNLQDDGYTCDPFTPKNGESYESYYQSNRIDYVFVEKPRPDHDVHIDVSRVRTVAWRDYDGHSDHPNLADHPGLMFDIVTSPPT
jgi:endonuclease/exonuclease/phosphatase family metal-dependent hydrolase